MSRLVIIIALAFAAPALANVSQRSFPGSRSTEPNGLRAIAIEHEQLSFDLRGIEAHGPAHIAAVYELDNRSGEIVTAPLIFVSGATADSFEVTFDGTKVPSGISNDVLPPAWNPPTTTPAFEGDEPYRYSKHNNDAIVFTLAIPPGRHRLAVQYIAIPSRAKGEAATIVYQVGYVLAPARDWASFGALDVSVEVPPGWHTATSLSLARSGDTLRGHFTSLPADTIGITVRANPGTLHTVLQFALPVLALLVLVGGGYGMYRLGRSRGRADDLRAVWPVSLPAALLWAVAIAVSIGFVAFRAEIGIPEGESGSHGYAGAFIAFIGVIVALLAIPIGMVIAKAASR